MSADFNFISTIADGASFSERRPNLLRHVTDLFIVSASRLSETDINLFDDIFTRLTVDIEIAARALLAMRLAPIPNAPPRTIRRLAFDDAIEVSGPVLRQSERLDDEPLAENAKNKSQAHLLAISLRRKLTPIVTDVLIERGDKQVLLSTVQNSGATFSDCAFARLANQSENDDILGVAVGTRADIPPHVFRQLLRQASETVRVKLEALHPNNVDLVRDVVSEVTDRIERDRLDPSLDLENNFGFSRERASSNPEHLAEIARRGSFAELAIALARVCEMSVVFVESALRQRRSDTVLLLAKANGIPWPTVRAILEFRARLGVITHRDVEIGLASYEQLVPKTAQRILRFYRSQ